MPPPWPVPLEGGCSCGHLRYRLTRTPMYVHCCSCDDCQRETGSAFAINALVEADRLEVLPPQAAADAPPATPLLNVVPSASGAGQLMVRCSRCLVVVWSHYGGAGPYVAFLRAGTLDRRADLQGLVKPDIFIYCRSAQPWLALESRAEKTVDEFYGYRETWPAEDFARLTALRGRSKEWTNRGARWEELAVGEFMGKARL